ncbi:MAG: glycosyltransferase [Candidatus Polarisedimenticolaceae bacterium]|nr:glycosyltransferase [Candidatus Polarisedimenticolaceae bacterium]
MISKPFLLTHLPYKNGVEPQIKRCTNGSNGFPRISIVTIVYNAEAFLEQTIESVVNQTYSHIEYIIIDGGSNDDSVKIIKRYGDLVDYWVSEPDRGIAHAMNKGIQVSTGDYILFLHADDYFLDEQVVQTAVSKIDDGCDIAAFNIIFQNAGGSIEYPSRDFNYWLNFKTSLRHQAVLCSGGLFKRLGGFDESYNIAMDYEFWLRAYREGIKPNIFNYALTCMRDTGISSRSDWSSMKQRFLEERRIHYQHLPNFSMRVIYKIYWAFYLPYRYVKSKW